MNYEDARKLTPHTQILVDGYDNGENTYRFREPRPATFFGCDQDGIRVHICDPRCWTTTHVPFDLAHLPPAA